MKFTSRGKVGIMESTRDVDHRLHLGSQHSEPVIKGEQMTLDNLSIWIFSDAPDEELRMKTRLKNLQFFRSMEEPHQEINQFHAGEQLVGVVLCFLPS